MLFVCSALHFTLPVVGEEGSIVETSERFKHCASVGLNHKVPGDLSSLPQLQTEVEI